MHFPDGERYFTSSMLGNHILLWFEYLHVSGIYRQFRRVLRDAAFFLGGEKGSEKMFSLLNSAYGVTIELYDEPHCKVSPKSEKKLGWRRNKRAVN